MPIRRMLNLIKVPNSSQVLILISQHFTDKQCVCLKVHIKGVQSTNFEQSLFLIHSLLQQNHINFHTSVKDKGKIKSDEIADFLTLKINWKISDNVWHIFYCC